MIMECVTIRYTFCLFKILVLAILRLYKIAVKLNIGAKSWSLKMT